MRARKTKRIELTYPGTLYLAWKRGRLHYKWYRQYRQTFDEDDLRLARNPYLKGIHFAEWFAAIYYSKKGHKVLIEKYVYGIHRRKRKLLVEILGERGLRLLGRWRTRYHCQPPDLFLFKGKKYFFVEVKRGRDSLRQCQKAYFKNIERVFGCPVFVLDLQAEKPMREPLKNVALFACDATQSRA